jgi:hypothetical protein
VLAWGTDWMEWTYESMKTPRTAIRAQDRESRALPIDGFGWGMRRAKQKDMTDTPERRIRC